MVLTCRPVERRRIRLLRAIARRVPPFVARDRLFSALPLGLGTEQVKLGGGWVELDMADPYERLAALGLYQPDLLDVLRASLRPGDCFCDCGAHVGLVSIPLAHHLGATGVVYAFEPSTSTYARLARNLEVQGPTACKIVAVPFALGSREGRAELLVSSQHGWSTMSRSASAVSRRLGEGITHTAQVDVVTLDGFFLRDGRRPPDAVKIDVEGWEEDVVRGGKELFTQKRPRVVVIERNELILAATGRSWRSIEELMVEYGYEPSVNLEMDVVFRPAG